MTLFVIATISGIVFGVGVALIAPPDIKPTRLALGSAAMWAGIYILAVRL